jgi:hypothetical protein
MPAVEPRPVAPDPVSEAARPVDTQPMRRGGDAPPMAPIHTQPLARVAGRPDLDRAHPRIDASSGPQRVDTMPLARPDGTPVAPVRSLADQTLPVPGSLAPVDTLELHKEQLPGRDVADTLDVPLRGGPFRDTLDLQRDELPEPIRKALERLGGTPDDTISDDGEEEEPSIDIEVDEPIILARDDAPTEDDSDDHA